MIQQTSLQSFIEMQNSSKLNANQTIIIDIFKNANKMALSNYDVSIMLDWPINTITPRVNELRKIGKLVTVHTKTQLQTGRKVNCYMLRSDAIEYFDSLGVDSSTLLVSSHVAKRNSVWFTSLQPQDKFKNEVK